MIHTVRALCGVLGSFEDMSFGVIFLALCDVWSAPSHYLKQRANWTPGNILQRNSNQNKTLQTFQENAFQNVVYKMSSFFVLTSLCVSTLRSRRNGCHFADDLFKSIFLNENIWILIEISRKFVSKGQINNISALVQIMAWRRACDKPLSESMIVRLPMHIGVTRPQWVNPLSVGFVYVRDINSAIAVPADVLAP